VKGRLGPRLSALPTPFHRHPLPPRLLTLPFHTPKAPPKPPTGASNHLGAPPQPDRQVLRIHPLQQIVRVVVAADLDLVEGPGVQHRLDQLPYRFEDQRGVDDADAAQHFGVVILGGGVRGGVGMRGGGEG